MTAPPSTPLEIPTDGPRKPVTGAQGSWIEHTAAAPPTSTPDLAAAVLAVLARLTGSSLVGAVLDAAAGSAMVEVEVTAATTLAELADLAGQARPASGVLSAQVRVGDGARPRMDAACELAVHADPAGSVTVAGAAELYQDATVRRIAEMIARAVVARSDTEVTMATVATVPVLSAAQARLLDELNDTAAPVPDGTVVDLIGGLPPDVLDQPAVVWSSGGLSYRELLHASRTLAAELVSAGAGPGTWVHVLLPRGAPLVVAWLAVLASGAACVPLDPAYPADRLATLGSTTTPVVTLTEPGLVDAVPTAAPAWPVDLVALLAADLPAEPSPGRAAATDVAYVMHTSGSTGTPKGVQIEHQSLVNLVTATARQFGLRPGRRSLQLSTPGFDVAVWEIFAPLSIGATIVVFDEPEVTAGALATVVSGNAVDTVFLLSSLVVRLDPADFPGVRTVITGGEAFGRELVDRWQPGRQLIYVYGPTEATVFQSWHRCYAGSAVAPPTIGRPMANLRYHVVDAWGAQAAPGVIGELYVGGIGPGRGYVGLLEDNRAKFLPDRFAGDGGRLYRTGDLASHRPDGDIDFRGRADGQVKIRGFRIEPGEVEAAIAQLPGVTTVAVVATDPASGTERQLVGYLVAEPGFDPESARQALAARLPYHLVPAALVVVDALPYTANGKIDRKQLARAPLPPAPAASRITAPGSGALVDTVVAVFRTVLRTAEIGPDDNFFGHGGHSLAAAQVAADLSAVIGVRVSARDVFDCLTPARLAGRVGAAGAENRSAGDDPAATPVDGPVRPLRTQRWLWLDQQARPEQAQAYNVPVLFRCPGEVDVGSLRSAIEGLFDRHPLLRARFVEQSGEPVLRLDVRPPGLRVAATAEADLARAVDEEANRPFDLATGPLIRFTLFRLPDGHDELLVVAQHTVCDGPSLDILAADLVVGYDHARGVRIQKPAPALGFAELSRACAGLEPHRQAGQLAYWRAKLDPPPEPAALPVDRARTEPPGLRTGSVVEQLDDEVVSALGRLCEQERTGLFAGLLAVVQLVLAEVTGDREVTVGTAVNLRPLLGLTGQVGSFVHTVALRLAHDGDRTFRDLLGQVAGEVVDAVDNATYPFDELVRELAPPRPALRNPYFDVWVTHYDQTDVSGVDLSLTGGPVVLRSGLFDLSFQFRSADGQLRLLLQYDELRFERATAAMLLDRVRLAMAAATAAPDRPVGRLDLRTAAEHSVDERPIFGGFRFGPPAHSSVSTTEGEVSSEQV